MKRDTSAALHRVCMRDRIRDTLVSRILDDGYPPGTRLKELELAREFQVSQAPIREALRELEALGLVVSERYRGTSVRSMNSQELREAYELRFTIEARAAELAVPVAGQDLAALERQLAAICAAQEAGLLTQLVDATLQYHRLLVECSRNRAFLQAWDSMGWDVRARVALRLIYQAGRDVEPMIDLHIALMERLRASDGPGAAAAVWAIFERFASLMA